MMTVGIDDRTPVKNRPTTAAAGEFAAPIMAHSPL